MIRALVTGFHDWRDLNGAPSTNLFRCRDNPSCRLLLGLPSSAPTLTRKGELAERLRRLPEHSHHVEWVFQTLPTVWGTASGLDLEEFDVVFHLGLGVYGKHDTILLEDGAYNSRNGPDAVGIEGGASLEYGAPQVLENKRMSAAVRQLDGEHVSEEFVVSTLPARPQNSYICNETHWRGLKALQCSESRQGRLKAVFFIHLPIPKKYSGFGSDKSRKAYVDSCVDLDGHTTDYTPLAVGVAETIRRLMQEIIVN